MKKSNSTTWFWCQHNIKNFFTITTRGFCFCFLWKSPMRLQIWWPMGCIFSSPSTSESRKKPSSSNNNRRRRWRRSAQERALTDVGVRNGAAEKERRNVNNRARVKPCMVRNQQVWPAWLVEVTDDVIKD